MHCEAFMRIAFIPPVLPAPLCFARSPEDLDISHEIYENSIWAFMPAGSIISLCTQASEAFGSNKFGKKKVF